MLWLVWALGELVSCAFGAGRWVAVGGGFFGGWALGGVGLRSVGGCSLLSPPRSPLAVSSFPCPAASLTALGWVAGSLHSWCAALAGAHTGGAGRAAPHGLLPLPPRLALFLPPLLLPLLPVLVGGFPSSPFPPWLGRLASSPVRLLSSVPRPLVLLRSFFPLVGPRPDLGLVEGLSHVTLLGSMHCNTL